MSRFGYLHIPALDRFDKQYQELQEALKAAEATGIKILTVQAEHPPELSIPKIQRETPAKSTLRPGRKDRALYESKIKTKLRLTR